MIRKLIPTSVHSWVALATLSLLVFAKLFVVNYSGDLSMNTKQRIEVFYIMGTVVVCCGWMFSDRRRLGDSLVSLGPAIVAIFWPVGIPLYLVSTRKAFGISKILIAVILLALAALLGGYTGRTFHLQIEPEQAGAYNP